MAYPESFIGPMRQELTRLGVQELRTAADVDAWVKVMDEVGIDVSGQTSKGVETYLGKVLFQHLVTVCDDADKNCPTVWPGVNNRMHWSFQDPAAVEGTDEEKLAKFREIRDLIEVKIKSWLAEQSG